MLMTRITRKILIAEFAILLYCSQLHGTILERGQLTEHSKFVITSNGAFLLPTHDTIIGSHMQTFGEWEETELLLFYKILLPGDVAIEIGANIGTHTIPLAKKLNNGGQVIAFEMIRSTFHFLTANLAINGITNVCAYNYALGEFMKRLDIGVANFQVDSNIGSASLWNFDIPANSNYLTTPLDIITLDSFYNNTYGFFSNNNYQKQLKCPKLIKTDAEGYDEFILKGSWNIIQKLNMLAYHVNTPQHEIYLDEYSIPVDMDRGMYLLHDYSLTMVYDIDPPVYVPMRQDGDETSCLTFKPI
eukprot:gene753-1437_t